MFLLGFPLLLIPFAIYNIIALIMTDVSWTTQMTKIHMMSGQDWVMSYEDALLVFSILLLAVEILKSTRIGIRSIIDHVLSMALFIVMMIEFLMVKKAGTSTFFLLMMLSLVDVIAGFIVTIRTSQRSIEVDRPGGMT